MKRSTKEAKASGRSGKRRKRRILGHSLFPTILVLLRNSFAFAQCRLLLLLLLQSSVLLVTAHRPLPRGVTCSGQFSSPDAALVIPNPNISWSSKRIFTCDQPVFWLQGDFEENQIIAFTVTVPVIERFRDVRISVAFLGKGLPSAAQQPQQDEHQGEGGVGVISSTCNIPKEISDYLEKQEQHDANNHLGMALYKSPVNQSTCNHLQQVMYAHSTVVNGRCDFYERHGGSNNWVVLDEELVVPASGLYKIAVYVEGGTTAKAGFACCAWSEDFRTYYPMPDTTCPFCGTNPVENPAASSYYREHKSMAQYGGFPPAVRCDKDDNDDDHAESSMDLQPDPDRHCPPLIGAGGGD